MFRYLAYVFMLVFAAIGVAQAQSIHTMPIGTEVETKVRFARSEVPLPPGKWVLVSKGEEQSIGLNGAMGARLPYATLARIERNALVGLVNLTGTVQYENLQWVRDRQCDRTDFYFLDADRNYNNADQRCQYATHFVRTWTASDNQPEQTRAMVQGLRAKSIALPPTTIVSVNRRVVGGEYLTVTYEISPASIGGPVARTNTWSASEWHKDKIAENPEHKRFLDTWVEWSKQMAPKVRDGFGRSLSDYAPIAIAFEPPVARAAAPAATGPAVPDGFAGPIVGTRFQLADGEIRIMRADGANIVTANEKNQIVVWRAGMIAWDRGAHYLRAAIESIFPLAVGKKVSFVDTVPGRQPIRQSLDVVRQEQIQVAGRSLSTFVVEQVTEYTDPADAGLRRKRTLWYAPEVGWLLRQRDEQLAGPPQRMNSWDVVRIVPPGG
jgi:hypothetical protein